MRAIVRSGEYFRVCNPDWIDPLDTRFAKMTTDNRWNVGGEFGALYLNRTVEVAAANARAQHARRAIGLFDLKPDRRPHMLIVSVPTSNVLDVVTVEGIRELKLPQQYPFGVDRGRCRTIARRAYAEGSLRGIACRSAAECTRSSWLGEELAWFDRSPSVRACSPRLDFAAWYPGLKP